MSDFNTFIYSNSNINIKPEIIRFENNWFGNGLKKPAI